MEIPLVIIESPFKPTVDPSKDRMCYERELAEHVAYARASMHDCLLRGEAPYASHLLYTQEGVLCDDIPEEREMGIEAGLAWGRCADLTAVYIDFGISKGMKRGIHRARSLGRAIEYRSLYGNLLPKEDTV